ncbi:endochitinase-like [Topomyia yanbarensis]|uniref:endochitinase-like n=1 Tax=Topomyia yanbarensis TaxID=2498891 RepID=UPI00273B3EC5|nr:endochitinase-like [Topomyia yanbarensis]
MIRFDVFVLFITCFCGNIEAISQGSALTVCYFSNWAIFRPGIGRYSLDDIPGGLCTHVLYAFVGFSEKSPLKITEMKPADDVNPNGLRKFSELRNRFPSTKLLVSVGGWGQDSSVFSTMVSSAENRRQFCNSVVSLLNAFELDGFNFQWLWPGHASRGGTTNDKANFALLLKELSDAFELDGHDRELTVTAPIEEFRLNEGYAVTDVCRYVDYIYLTAYELRGPWNNFTDVHTPMQGRSFESEAFKHFNVMDGVSLWTQRGCPVGKLVLGVTTQGITYTLKAYNENGLGAPINGPGEMGEFTKSAGYMSYYEICKRIQDGWKVRRDGTGKVPFITKNDQWIGYDDIESLKLKVNLVRQRGLAGAMIYALDMDDYRGLCGQRYPITEFISAEMKKIPAASNYDITFGIDRESYDDEK